VRGIINDKFSPVLSPSEALGDATGAEANTLRRYIEKHRLDDWYRTVKEMAERSVQDVA
jgi:hypothetical protein